MIDIQKAEKAFEEYLKSYDLNNGKVALKVRHTYGVVRASEMLAKSLNLTKEDSDLSKLIAFLHDIGRFEQSKVNSDVYDNADKQFFDHGEYGVKVLFEEGLIRNFIEDNSYDEIIKKSILNHNKLEIEEGLNEKELLHAKLVRDNDKLDNFRVKLEESFKVLLGTDDMNLIENEVISDDIYKTFLSKRLITYGDVKTCLDRWMSYIAYIFDFNFPESFKYLDDNDMINKNFDRINYKNPDTIKKIEVMKNLSKEYVIEKCKK